MARLSCEKRSELESFWHSHHDEWEHSALNQQEYCEVHGLPLKRFGNWRAKFKTECGCSGQAALPTRWEA